MSVEQVREAIATEHDRRLITAVSYALGGKIGLGDDIARLRAEIEGGPSTDKMHTACEIAVSFIRWAQDLKARAAESESLTQDNARLREACEAAIKHANSYEPDDFDICGLEEILRAALAPRDKGE